MIYRDGTPEDAKKIADIDSKSFTSEAWSLNSILEEMQEKDVHVLVAEDEAGPVGYLCFRQIFDEAHIANVAVLPERRGEGIADGLFETLDLKCERLGILYQTLEVRESNRAAIRLYEKHGFVRLGVRRQYYTDPAEDGLIYWHGIPEWLR